MVDKTVQLAGIVAVIVIAGLGAAWMASPIGQFALISGGGSETVAKWCNETGYFVEAVIIENSVGSCTYAGDNYNPFVQGYSIADGVEYADTCVDSDPNINMIEYSCKTVLGPNTTEYYLVRTEGTCTLDCRTKGNPRLRNACYSWRRVKCGSTSVEST